MFRRTWIIIILAMAALTQTPGTGQEKKRGKSEKLPGLIWIFTVTDGKDEIKGQFRVFQKVVYRGDKKVGTVNPKSGRETELVITDFPKLNGTAHLKRAEARTAKWKGELKRKDGSMLPISVDVKEM
jgi:hypothetical protein